MPRKTKPPARRVSLADVACTAGVSKMTVSRVINRHPGVNADTVAAIQAVLDRLGYEVKPADTDGRRLRSRSRIGLHHGRIAVLIPDDNLAALRTPMSGRLLEGIDRRLKSQRLQMLITGLPTARELPHFIAPRHVDGVLIRSGLQDWLPRAIAASGVAAVWMFESAKRRRADEVLPDNACIVRLAAERFAAMACVRVLVVRDVPDHPAHEQRIDGLRTRLAALGIPMEEVVLHDRPQGTWTECLRMAMARMPGTVGVFIPGTGMVVMACAQAAAQIPGSRSRLQLVACSNDLDMLGHVPHPVANVDIGPEAIGEAAVDLLLQRLAEPDAAPRTVIVRPTLKDWP